MYSNAWSFKNLCYKYAVIPQVLSQLLYLEPCANSGICLVYTSRSCSFLPSVLWSLTSQAWKLESSYRLKRTLIDSWSSFSIGLFSLYYLLHKLRHLYFPPPESLISSAEIHNQVSVKFSSVPESRNCLQAENEKIVGTSHCFLFSRTHGSVLPVRTMTGNICVVYLCQFYIFLQLFIVIYIAMEEEAISHPPWLSPTSFLVLFILPLTALPDSDFHSVLRCS